MKDNPIKILIADDHSMVVEGIRAIIQKEKGLKVSGVASTGQQVIDAVAIEPPDLILMDINMPEMDGIETTKQIKRSYPKIKVIIVSMYNTAEFISNSLAFGASGYLLKNTGMDELHKAIETVLEDKVFLSKEAMKVYRAGRKKLEKRGRNNNILTDREISIIKLMVDENSTEEIATKLNLSPHTIKTHRRNIMNKLKVKNITGLIKFAVNRGWDQNLTAKTK